MGHGLLASGTPASRAKPNWTFPAESSRYYLVRCASSNQICQLYRIRWLNQNTSFISWSVKILDLWKCFFMLTSLSVLLQKALHPSCPNILIFKEDTFLLQHYLWKLSILLKYVSWINKTDKKLATSSWHRLGIENHLVAVWDVKILTWSLFRLFGLTKLGCRFHSPRN